MDERLRFLLYGTYDGFSRSSFGDDNILLVLDNGDRAEIPRHFVKNASDFIEKNKIKLKDVITRIKGLNLGTQKVWLNEILNELGSDYGTLKYKDGYEQGKLYGEWVGQQLKDADKIRLELNKPVVPQFVADWYEDIVDEFYVVLERLVLNYQKNTDMPICKWFFENEDALKILINMHQFGYTVEKEKRFLVKMKGVDSRTNYLYYGMGSNTWLFKPKLIDGLFRKNHTRKELEDAGFGEVFNSPLFEVEEVE